MGCQHSSSIKESVDYHLDPLLVPKSIDPLWVSCFTSAPLVVKKKKRRSRRHHLPSTPPSEPDKREIKSFPPPPPQQQQQQRNDDEVVVFGDDSDEQIIMFHNENNNTENHHIMDFRTINNMAMTDTSSYNPTHSRQQLTSHNNDDNDNSNNTMVTSTTKFRMHRHVQEWTRRTIFIPLVEGIVTIKLECSPFACILRDENDYAVAVCLRKRRFPQLQQQDQQQKQKQKQGGTFQILKPELPVFTHQLPMNQRFKGSNMYLYATVQAVTQQQQQDQKEQEEQLDEEQQKLKNNIHNVLTKCLVTLVHERQPAYQISSSYSNNNNNTTTATTTMGNKDNNNSNDDENHHYYRDRGQRQRVPRYCKSITSLDSKHQFCLASWKTQNDVHTIDCHTMDTGFVICCIVVAEFLTQDSNRILSVPRHFFKKKKKQQQQSPNNNKVKE